MNDMPRRVLSTLLISGAQSPERAVSSDDLAVQFGFEKAKLQSEIEALGRGGYVQSVIRDDVRLVYLSLTGVLAASSIYS